MIKINRERDYITYPPLLCWILCCIYSDCSMTAQFSVWLHCTRPFLFLQRGRDMYSDSCDILSRPFLLCKCTVHVVKDLSLTLYHFRCKDVTLKIVPTFNFATLEQCIITCRYFNHLTCISTSFSGEVIKWSVLSG